MYESQHDWASESPSTAVVRAVASVANCEPHDLPALHASIDPDALNSLLGHESSDSTDLALSFGFAGWRVRASADGEVAIFDK